MLPAKKLEYPPQRIEHENKHQQNRSLPEFQAVHFAADEKIAIIAESLVVEQAYALNSGIAFGINQVSVTGAKYGVGMEIKRYERKPDGS